KPAGKVCTLKQTHGHRIHGKGHDEQTDTSIGKYGTRQYNGKRRPLYTHFPRDPPRNTFGRAAVFHEFSKDGAEEEHDEPGSNEARESTHVAREKIGSSTFGKLRKDGDATEQGYEQRRQRRGNKQVDTP